MRNFSEKNTVFQWVKNVKNSWECWQIRKTGGQNTSRFDTSVLKAACFTIVIFWKVRHYEAKSLIFHAMFTSWSHCFYDIFFVICCTCLVLEYSVLQFAHFSKVRKFTRKTEASTIRKTGNQNGGKSVENSWECWTIRKTGSQNTSRFDTSMLKAACFTIVIFWKVRHYESKSLIFHAMFTGWSHYFYDLFFVIFYTCLVLEYSVLQFAHFSKVRKFTRKTEASYLDLGIFVRVFTHTEQQST